MQHSNEVILFGTGRLAFQVGRKLQAHGFSPVHIGSEHFHTASKTPQRESLIDYLRRLLREANIDTARAVFILDDEDRYNIQMARWR